MHKRHCPSPSSLRNCEQIPPSLRQNSCLGQQAYRRCYGPRLRAFSPQIFQELLYVTQGETTMATPQLTFNTGQTAILMADFHREGMGDNPMVRECGTGQKARA